MNANMAEPIQIDLNAFYGDSIVPRWQDLLRTLAIVSLSFATIGCSLRQDRDANFLRSRLMRCSLKTN
jgi:hypothetical protein